MRNIFSCEGSNRDTGEITVNGALLLSSLLNGSTQAWMRLGIFSSLLYTEIEFSAFVLQ